MDKAGKTDCQRQFKPLPLLLFIGLIFFSLIPPSARADSRVVRIGVYENAPKVFADKTGQPAGIFIDIIKTIASAEGWTLRYVPGTWAEGLERLEKGKIDLMPDVAYTADRAKKFAFHKIPVLSSWSQVYAHKGSNIKSILDLNGKRIAVLEGSIQQSTLIRLTSSFGLDLTFVPVPDYNTMFALVAGKEADAGVTNRFYGLMHSRQYGLEDTSIIFDPSDLFFAAPQIRKPGLLSSFLSTSRKNPEMLLAAIDRHLSEMKKDPHSAYYASLKRWTSEEVRFRLPAWLRMTGIVAAIILFLSLGGSALLKYQVNTQTCELKKINREMEQRIAEQKKTETRLAESEKKYRDLVQQANSIILRMTSEGRISFINEFGLRFFGYSSEEIRGRHVVGTIVPETESNGRDLGKLISDICADPKAYEENINENLKRNGEHVWISWTNRIVMDAGGEAAEILSVGTDITQRKRAQEQVKKLHEDLQQHATELERRVAARTAELTAAMEKAQAADRIKSAFLATMSHELRTPLNSIIGFTGIILQGLAGPLNEEQKKQMGMVQSSARHLLALINDVLDISKIEAGQLELSPLSFDVKESVKKAVALVRPLAGKKGIELRTDIADNVKNIHTDQRRLEQILLNLLNNAVKFTEKGHVSLSCERENHSYIFSISDTGIGIRADEIPMLFQPFHQIDAGTTRKHEGSGLGLSICKKLVDMMDGDISIKSQWGKGSTFTVRLPENKGNTI